MYYVFLINKVLLVLLGVSTGLVKVFKMQQEMLIFRNAGFSDPAIIAFGVVQFLAAVGLLFAPTAKVAALVLIVSFVIATGVLFKNDMLPFGFFSLLFIAMGILAYMDQVLKT